MNKHRIRTVFAKELIDILRDRRTLIAMIVVPIVLYPLLMLGSIQAVSSQARVLRQEALLIGTTSEEQQDRLVYLINEDAKHLDELRARAGSDEERESIAASLTKSRIAVAPTLDDLKAAVQKREIQLGVVFEPDADDPKTVQVRIFVDMEEVRSSSASFRVAEMFERLGDKRISWNLQQAGLPPSFVTPYAVRQIDLSSPPSILGQVLPLILILMTITGAIYPAIDLTAGERERGTLESLMVCPVPVFDLIVGKFLVVTTVAIMGAALNLTSVTLTVYFGGFEKMLSTTDTGLPIWTMLLILLCLVPFAVLMSAIMIAVCSYARTFKEAQNYVTPVILAVLIPGGIAALPATRLEGVMLVMPVGNMVLLSRDLLLGAEVSFADIGLVLLSTTLYASAAVAIASGIFGRESVVFSDSGSLRSLFARRLMKPRTFPTPSFSLMYVALLFPVWFFVQSSLSPADLDEGAGQILYGTAMLMPVLFVIVPSILLIYFKTDPVSTFALRLPSMRFLLAAVLLGFTAFVPAHEINQALSSVVAIPDGIHEQFEALAETLRDIPMTHALVVTAVIPAICEELLFRGLLLSGMRGSCKRWLAILACAAVFGVFHFILFRFPVTFILGAVLGFLCWQSRSVVPAIIAHMLHNGLATTIAINPERFAPILGEDMETAAHLPVPVLVGGGILFVVGLILSAREQRDSALPHKDPA